MSEDDKPAVTISSPMIPILQKYADRWRAKGWKTPAVNHDEKRDFIGYGRNVPTVSWPGGKKVAITFVVNFEEGGEFSIGDGDTHNEGIYEVIDQEEGVRDFCIESHFEYGTRIGYWRLIDAFDRYNVKATVSSCGRAVEKSPWLVKDAFDRGHEIAGHGYRWETHAKMDFAEEDASIAKCVASIKSVVGVQPYGWHTRSERSKNTRRLLMKHGFVYSDDAYNDDTPYYVKVDDQLHLILPYSFDTNDMQFQNTNRFNTAASFSEYVIDSFDWLCKRESNIPRMMTIGLHLRMITRPGRMPALESILEHIRGSGLAWIATREQVARHWIKMTGYDSVDGLETPRVERLYRVPEPDDHHKYQLQVSRGFNLLVINPNTTQSSTELIVNHIKSIVPPSVCVYSATAKTGASVICSEASYARATPAVVDAYIDYVNSDGAVHPDAIMVGCFGDPGVFALREYLRENNITIPVLGLAEAAMRQAASKRGKFVIITGGTAWGPILTRLAKGWELSNFLSSVHTVSLNGAQLAADRPAAISLLAETCTQALIYANGKASSSLEKCTSIILGGALLAGMADDISRFDLGVPVIDSVTAGVEMLAKALTNEAFAKVIS